MSTLRIAAAVALAGLLTPCVADAYWWSGAGIGIGEVYRSLDYPTDRRVPYFAAHPPVYYSVPVPRTYGYSPFAYGPEVRTPDIAPMGVQPVEILNPYVPSSSRGNGASSIAPKQEPTRSRTISNRAEGEKAPTGPLMIINPYVTSGPKNSAVKSKTI